MIKKMVKKISHDDGFTLIEMSLVLFVISALLLLFIPNLSGRQESAELKSNEAIETVLQSQVDLYIMDKNQKPTSFDTLKSEKYLTENQALRAKNEYTIVNGIVTKNTQ
ncbi:competence type IV pilus major pilin ComGC [Alkalibacterium olivapovliticus]|uniref:Competence protein ComGC n=1 Tax=Alkalibacterium olivapovliticus TaxID=99907 RepID=A0A2T0W643_9LACT|nr:competence type IV pilus major pilin ComGC [Alkalibacterium olivapovliticus]PRY82165.1 competence protein ComGC [Alkalibacterium olivapovliticus]